MNFGSRLIYLAIEKKLGWQMVQRQGKTWRLVKSSGG